MALIKPPLGARLDSRSRLARGLVGCWLFNEGAGVKVFDISGRGNAGTLTGMANPSTSASGWTAHRFGNGLAFDGTNDYVQMASPWYASATGLTLSFWMYVINATGAILSIASSVGSGTPALLFQRDSASTARWYFPAGAPTPYRITQTVLAKQWYHITITYDGTTWAVYKNGIPDGSTATGLGANASTYMFLGAGYNAGGVYTSGNIDNVRVYGRALSQAEISELYRNPYAGISFSNWKRKRIYSSTSAAPANYGRGFFGFM